MPAEVALAREGKVCVEQHGEGVRVDGSVLGGAGSVALHAPYPFSLPGPD